MQRAPEIFDDEDISGIFDEYQSSVNNLEPDPINYLPYMSNAQLRHRGRAHLRNVARIQQFASRGFGSVLNRRMLFDERRAMNNLARLNEERRRRIMHSRFSDYNVRTRNERRDALRSRLNDLGNLDTTNVIMGFLTPQDFNSM